MRHLLLATVLLVVAGWPQVAAAQSETERLVAESNPAVQAQIRATAIAFLSGGRSDGVMRSNWQGFREIAKLKGLAGTDDQLVMQLAIYCVAEQRQEEHQVLEALLLLELLHLKPSIVVRVLAPYLDSDDKVLRGFVRDWFESDSTRGARGVPQELAAHYKVYADYISLTLDVHGEIPAPLVDFMYEQSPEQALLAFLRIDRRGLASARLIEIRKNLEAAREGRAAVPGPRPQPEDWRRDIRLAARLISNAIWFKENGHDQLVQAALPEVNELLAKLAEHDRWWARRYVVEIMRRHRELRQAEVLEKLKDDPDPLVSEAVTFGVER